MENYKVKKSQKAYIQLAVFLLLFVFAMIFLLFPPNHAKEAAIPKSKLRNEYFSFAFLQSEVNLSFAPNALIHSMEFNSDGLFITKTQYVSSASGGIYSVSGNEVILNEGLESRTLIIRNNGESLLEKDTGRIWWRADNYPLTSAVYDINANEIPEVYCLYDILSSKSKEKHRYTLVVYEGENKIFEQEIRTDLTDSNHGLGVNYSYSNDELSIVRESRNLDVVMCEPIYSITYQNGKIKLVALDTSK